MATQWAKNDNLGSGSTLEGLHAGLTVRMIETPRTQLKTCSMSDMVSSVVDANVERYDYLPVIAQNSSEGIAVVGLLHAEGFRGRSPCHALVSKHMLPLTEERLVGADTSILDFVVEAHAKPCRLVVSNRGFSGLVTLSDLQRLPVRAALFALITEFEMVMLEVIGRKFPGQGDWLPLLSEDRQRELTREIERSKRADGFVTSLLFTSFSDKSRIVRQSGMLLDGDQDLVLRFDSIRRLRNKLAHANEYAASPAQARCVSLIVKDLLELRSAIAS